MLPGVAVCASATPDEETVELGVPMWARSAAVGDPRCLGTELLDAAYVAELALYDDASLWLRDGDAPICQIRF